MESTIYISFFIFYGLLLTGFLLHNILFKFFLKCVHEKHFSLIIPIQKSDELFIFIIPTLKMMLSFFSLDSLIRIVLVDVYLSDFQKEQCLNLCQKYQNVFCYTIQNFEELTNEFRG